MTPRQDSLMVSTPRGAHNALVLCNRPTNLTSGWHGEECATGSGSARWKREAGPGQGLQSSRIELRDGQRQPGQPAIRQKVVELVRRRLRQANEHVLHVREWIDLVPGTRRGKLNKIEAVSPPASEPQKGQFFRPMAIRFISRSAALLSVSVR